MTPFDSRTRDKAAEALRQRFVAIVEAHGSNVGPGSVAMPSDDTWLSYVDAVLGALPAASPGGWMVPEGYKLVPVEPTQAMFGAGGVQMFKCDMVACDPRETIGLVYRAILEAAPPPPSQDGDAG